MNALLFYLFLLVVLLAPLPLGSNRPWSWTLLASALAVLAVLWSVQGVLRPRLVSLSLPMTPVLLFLMVCLWAGLQVAPWTPAGWHHPLWTLSNQALDTSAGSRISLSPDHGMDALLRLLSYGLAFFLAFQWCRDVGRARMLFLTLAAWGVVLSVYGLTIYWGKLDRFLLAWALDYRQSVRGTFVNPNHFATWLGLCLLCLLASFQDRLMPQRRNPAYQLPGSMDERWEHFLRRSWPFLAGLILMVSALILSRSRGGFIAVVLGVSVLVWAINRRGSLNKGRVKALVITGLLVSGLAFFITSEVLLSQVVDTPADMDVRLQGYTLAGEGLGDNSLLGFGYGTFEEAFRLYRDESIGGRLDKAHNSYLENLFELGWPAAILLFLSIGWMALRCGSGVLRRRKHWIYPATGLAATVLVGIHALVDFSLQIPATAVTFAAILGAGVAQSRGTRR